MSGQWEVVGKKKDRSTKSGIPVKPSKEAAKKKDVANNVKIDEVLAKSQVKNLYTNNNNANSKVEKKPVVKKPQKKAAEKAQEAPKPKPPKSIESALNSIDAVEFKNIFERNRLQFPDLPIVWLKELAQFLNQKVAVDLHDPVFSSKPATYPLNVVPGPIKSVIETAVKEAGKRNVQVFFDVALASMVTDMGRNQAALGHKIFLQYIAISEPSLLVQSMNKHCDLRASYVNRPNICLSLLWAVGCAGFTDTQVGFKVFQELMLPIIELKNFAHFIVSYLFNLLTTSKDVVITKEQYLLVLDLIYSGKKNFPSEIKQGLISILPNLIMQLLAASKKNYTELFEFYLKNLTRNSNKSYQDCLCDVLVEVLCRDQGARESWGTCYSKNIKPSAFLLSYIDKHWNEVGGKLTKKGFNATLSAMNGAIEELVEKKKKEDGLLEAIPIIKKLSNKKMEKTRRSSSYTFKFFLLALAVGGLIYVDVVRNGSWKESKTSRTLKEYGVCEYVHRGMNYGRQGVDWVDNRLEDSFPGYKKTVAEYSEPYVILIRDLGYVAKNFWDNIKQKAIEKYPAVRDSFEKYAPGLIQQSQNAVSNAWSTSVFYFNRSIDYLKTEVFVGQLSPENMQRVVIEALNTTQSKATEYYHWLYEKVQTTIK